MNGPAIQIGSPADEVVAALVASHPNLKTVSFTVYTPRAPVEDRLVADPDVRRLLDRVKQASRDLGLDLPWEEFAVSAALRTRDLDRVLRETGAHTTSGEGQLIEVAAADEFTPEWIRRMASDARAKGKVLGMCSRCLLADNTVAHIPMMDFRCQILGENAERIEGVVNSIAGMSGVLLESGRSYHWYGFELLNPQDWVTFMGTCLLYSPLVDTRYIAHRLKEWNGVLRVSAGGSKPKVPVVQAFTKSLTAPLP
jgi:hypothetical protein